MHEQKSSSTLKRMARGQLAGRYAIPMGAVVILSLISAIATLILNRIFSGYTLSSLILNYIAAFILALLLSVLEAGLSYLILHLVRGQEVRLSDLLYGFSNQPDRIILAVLVTQLLSFACMIPTILLLALGFILESLSFQILGVLALLGGIVAMVWLLLTYSMICYVYLDHPEKGVMEILRTSRKLMIGNKGRYLYLQVSFIGLLLLSVFSCGIGLLWVSPYIETTTALFYLDLTGEA